MVSGARLEGGGQVIPVRIRKTIHSIREIVGNHSDADIYAVLKETNMDPNETAQRLLNQDPFHEVKRKRDKRKEFTDYKLGADPRKHTDSIHQKKANKSMHLNAPRGGLTGSYVPDARINKEFRVVRDNRVSQNFNKDVKSDSIQHSLKNEHVNSNISERRSIRIINDQKLLNSTILDGHGISQNLNASSSHGLDHEKDLSRVRSSRALPPVGIMIIHQSTNSEPERVVVNSSTINSSSAPINSVNGVYSSSSDPVHVPSPASRSSGSVGAIRREVGAVGVKKMASDIQPTNSAVSNNSHSAILGGKVILSSAESLRGSATNIISSQLSQVPSSDAIMPTTSNRRGVHNNSKQHIQTSNHQRAMQPNMEWKPKSQKLKNDSSSTVETVSILASSNDNAFSSNLVNAIDLSDKLSNTSIHGELHVIIPQHLRVPEAECTKFTFGSFGDVSVSSPGFLPTQQAIGRAERSEVTPSVSNSAFVPVGPNNETSVEVGHLVDCQAGTLRSTSPASAEELEQPPSGDIEPLNPQSIESYADIGLVQRHSPPFSSQQSQRIPEIPSMPSFLPHDTETGYATTFFEPTLDDNVRGQSLASQPEILNLHSANSNPLNPTVITQQQQQQQALAQLYPHVHIPHYPNFMPYRHILSPVYVPPMALPSYSSNPAYAHPSTGNSYLLMPGGSSHLSTGGMKYAPSHYKPIPAGNPSAYGNYSSPAAFAIGTPSPPIGGSPGIEEMMRIKYKDNNLYVSNLQADPSDMWMQTPRELSNLQSMQYYNLSGHTSHPTHPPAFVSAHAAAAAAASGHASFNTVAATAQPSPMQYPGMYHPQQPSSMANPHHLVHQQVPPSVGLAAGGPQVGAFQQSQLGRLNWTPNF